MTYADVIVDITAKALDRPFQYLVPEDLEPEVEEGTIVEAPFGNGNRKITGYVMSLSHTARIDPEKIKPILGVVTSSSDEEKRLTALAVWIRDRYGSTMAAAMRTVLPARKKTAARQKKIVVLAVGEETAHRELDIMRRKHQSARVRLMEALVEEKRLPYEICAEKLHITSAVVTALVRKGLVTVERTRVYRNPALPEGFSRREAVLNEEQCRAVDTVCGTWDEGPCGRFLLYGVTGSGKTEVYIELIARAVAMGRQAIVLIPEIALTYQTMMRFYHRFGGRVSVIHSKMSAGEKQDQFDRARQGDLDVMIGPRSALFTPFPNLGIIVIDEEHEESYRSEQSPRYHATEVAFQRSKLEGACVVLGSATPSLEAYYAVQTGEITLIRLMKRAMDAQLPEVRIIDMRDELPAGNGSVISQELQSRMRETLGRGEQIMLFLNRRGYAGFISCTSCGHVIKCPHCDVSLTLHKGGRLLCHYCGYETVMPARCPECESPFLRTFQTGTEQVEQEVSLLFPDARIVRMDRDTVAGKDGQLKVLAPFASHEADIMIGTQMIVKGHDFPDVTLVGILMADLSLNIPNYRAAERTFQLLTQAAGRAGRAQRAGAVLIQTFQPSHYAVQCASRQDYDSFYRQEISYREMAGYPPCGSLVAVHMSCADQEHLLLAAGYVKQFLEKILGKAPVQILGPVSEPIAKIADVWRQVIYLKGGSSALLRAARNRLERYIELNDGFSTVEITFDSTI